MAKATELKKSAQRSGPVIDRSEGLPCDEISAWMQEADDDDAASQPPPPAARRREIAAPAPAAQEPVLRRLLGGEHKSQFLLLADWFESATTRRSADTCVETELGDVFFEVIDWIDTPGFLKIVVDGVRMPFRPKSMARLRIRRGREVFVTTCVYPLAPMFGQLPFAELLLVVDGVEPVQPPDQTTMEKNARITPGVTPSAVSGKPSDDVDNEEPVVTGEQAASVRGALAARDFDVSRDREED